MSEVRTENIIHLISQVENKIGTIWNLLHSMLAKFTLTFLTFAYAYVYVLEGKKC